MRINKSGPPPGRHRPSRRLTLMIGPPSAASSDGRVVGALLAAPGVKVVCGGTTAGIVARWLNKEIEVQLATASETVPAMGRLAGIDLVSEGVLTLAAVVGLLRDASRSDSIKGTADAASCLFKQIVNADELHVLLGKAVNPAHQSPALPSLPGRKPVLIEELASLARNLGKSVRVDSF